MVEHDLFDFLLLSLPDNDWYSHKRGPDAQLQSLAQADLQLARVCEAAGGRRRVPARARGDRDGRPLAGARDRHDRAAGRARRAGRARPRRAALRDGERAADRRLPFPARRDGLRAARARARRDARLGRHASRCAIEGVEHVMWLARDAHEQPTRGGHREPRARRAALRARRRRSTTRAACAGASTGRSAVIDGDASRDGRLLTPRLPRRARPRLGGADVPDLRRGAAVGRPRLRVPRLGAPGARRRRQPRLAARQRLARRARRAAASSCPTREPAQWAIRDVAPLVLGALRAGRRRRASARAG